MGLKKKNVWMLNRLKTFSKLSSVVLRKSKFNKSSYFFRIRQRAWSKRIKKFINKFFRVRKRFVILNVNTKLNKFDYRKKKEERLFYKKFVNNINICIRFPFLVHNIRGFIFRAKWPDQVKPNKPDTRMIRRRFLQPVQLRSVLVLRNPHNGLRKKKRRRL